MLEVVWRVGVEGWGLGGGLERLKAVGSGQNCGDVNCVKMLW